ncbi:MAG: hypothetical protein ACRDTH_07270, partial [Pseudonocardiaceae bacterium]
MQYPSTDRFGILFVCSGGRCRSPVAEVLARLLLDERFGSLQAARFDVSSAGTQAVPGEPIDPRTRTELVRLGLESGAPLPRSTPLSVDAIGSAHLVLTAERVHRSMVVQMAPDALGKTFCLREFARLVASIDCEGMPSEPIALARAIVVAARNNRGVIPPVPPSEDEIADPTGRGQTAHHVAAALVSSALVQILGVRPPVVAESTRRWSRPIRQWTVSPAAGRMSEESASPLPVVLGHQPPTGLRPRARPRTMAVATGLVAAIAVALPLTLLRASGSEAESSTVIPGGPSQSADGPPSGANGAPLAPTGTDTRTTGLDPADIPTSAPLPPALLRIGTPLAPQPPPRPTPNRPTGTTNPTTSPSSGTRTQPPSTTTPPPPTGTT